MDALIFPEALDARLLLDVMVEHRLIDVRHQIPDGEVVGSLLLVQFHLSLVWRAADTRLGRDSDPCFRSLRLSCASRWFVRHGRLEEAKCGVYL